MFEDKILNDIKTKLCAHSYTLAVAESVTGGLLQTAFSEAENASMFFQGGITAYNVGQKVKHLMVEPIHAIKRNCVAPKIAEEMAVHVCTLFHSDWGVSVTGYAAPVPESHNRLYAYYAICFQGHVLKQGKLDIEIADPFKVKVYYVNEILKIINHVIGNNEL
jgi:nicotinamide-nucleotide amidase